MRNLSFDHVAIPVTDVAASRHFYEGVLGLQLLDAMSGDDWEGWPWLLVLYRLADGCVIALSAFRGATQARDAHLPKDSLHYALSTEDLNSWRLRLQAASVPVREEDHGEQRSLYFEDPDGTAWEITSPSSRIGLHRNDEAESVIQAWLARKPSPPL